MNIKDVFEIRKAYLLVALGFVTILCLEGILYLITNNNPLLRLHSETGHYIPTLAGVNRDLNYYPKTLLNQNSDYFNFFGYFFYFVVAASIYIIVRWKKKAFILLVWLIPVLLYMQYGTMNPFEYTLIQRIWRFLTIITIPASLIVSFLLLENRLPFRRIILTMSVLFLLLTSIYYIEKISTYMNEAMSDFRLTADYLKKQEEKNIYADRDTLGKLDFFLGYERTEYLKDVAKIRNPKAIKDSYVVVGASRGYVEVPRLRNTLPEFIWNPPPNWNLVKVINESNIGFYGSYDTKIYYVP